MAAEYCTEVKSVLRGPLVRSHCVGQPGRLRGSPCGAGCVYRSMSERDAWGRASPHAGLEDGRSSQRQLRPKTFGYLACGWTGTCHKVCRKEGDHLPVDSCSGQCCDSGSLWLPPHLCRTGHTTCNKSRSWEPRTPLLGKGGEWTGSIS